MAERPALTFPEEVRLLEFPVARSRKYFAHAGVCPLPARVAGAMQAYLQDATEDDQERIIFAELIPDVRRLAAELLQVTPEEIAFVGPTSIGLSYVANGLSFPAGSNALFYFDDYPSNVYPWLTLQKKGVELRRLKPGSGQLGEITLDDVAAAVDGKTRLVALGSAHFISGYRLDYEAIGRFLRERGIYFCLDAIQTLGAFPVQAEAVDFLSADGHKWLLGPCGAGIFYVRKEVQPQLEPNVYGWNNVRCPNYVAQPEIAYRAGAQRYEAGTHNLAGLAGLRAAVGLLLEVGIPAIAADLTAKSQWIEHELRQRSWEVLGAGNSAGNASGIVSFYHPAKDMAALHQRLLNDSIITSLRTDRKGRQYIRLSPHFYNTLSELEALIQIVQDTSQSGVASAP